MKRIILTTLISTMTLVTNQAAAQTAKSAADLVKEAKAQIENLTPAQVKSEIDKGNVTIIDIREPEELRQNGVIPGSINAPRGMLEFYADSSLPYHKPEFKKDSRIILQCASGGRSALAVVTLKQMGYTNVAHLDGGFKAWKEAGLPVTKKE
ncbi:MAG TPA: rhodanese-like domain-containing protein [Cyclobacteriaceae bacterium]|jgi:rhodanese-related sulfurtransferase|nr:rhodanese-like domain-containing protein [Cyclobacteriaceae bacterium]HRE67345.1 rhodanese-like domain-containing protein [Cyclobacteriaceae bacterium]HRF33047.1 rhodanese-like domain-containing protein [Cyclobacteriaceae bacterium]